MFITAIKQKEKGNPNEYPFCIPSLKNFESLEFHNPISFFIGENGSGKSTMIEAIAILCGLNPEGGSKNMLFHTRNTHSILYRYLTVCKKGVPSTKYFLRAESFYNVASEIDRAKEEDMNDIVYASHGGKSLHTCSHGESFLALVENRFYPNGLYILDEPESALSPSNQMKLIVLIDDLVKKGSQFIIATHSPILLAMKDATIYDFDNHLKEVSYEDTEIYQIYQLFMKDPNNMIDKLLKED